MIRRRGHCRIFARLLLAAALMATVAARYRPNPEPDFELRPLPAAAGRPVTVSFVDTPMEKAVQRLAALTGVSIDVRWARPSGIDDLPIVDFTLDKIPLWWTLDRIFLFHGAGKVRQQWSDGGVMILPSRRRWGVDPASDSTLSVRMYEVGDLLKEITFESPSRDWDVPRCAWRFRGQRAGDYLGLDLNTDKELPAPAEVDEWRARALEALFNRVLKGQDWRVHGGPEYQAACVGCRLLVVGSPEGQGFVEGWERKLHARHLLPPESETLLDLTP